MANARTWRDGKQFHLERYVVLLNGSGANTTGAETLDVSYTKTPVKAVMAPEFFGGTADITLATNAQGNVTGWTWNISGGTANTQLELFVFLGERP